MRGRKFDGRQMQTGIVVVSLRENDEFDKASPKSKNLGLGGEYGRILPNVSEPQLPVFL